MRALTWPQVIARRLARSHLLDSAPPERLVDVVADVALIQAQILSAAELGLATRVRDATAEDVRHELYERRSLVKTWNLRGTLHLVPAMELPLWAAAARGPDPYWESREWLRANGLTAKSGTALYDAIAAALDGACLTRVELADSIAGRLGRRHDKLLSGWGELLAPAALMGILCFGPPQGANVTFVRADQWIDGWRSHDPHKARREVLRRYLRAYGPAKPGDFGRWSGFGREAVNALFEHAKDELEPVQIERTRGWILADDTADFDLVPSGIRLLPQYDAYVLGFRPRDPLVPDPVKERIKQDPKGRLETVTGVATLLVDGIVTGLWKREGGRTGTVVAVEPVQPLPARRRPELSAAVDRVGEIVG